MHRMQLKRREAYKKIGTKSIQNLENIDDRNRLEIAKRIIHNHEVATARAIHAHQIAEAKKLKALATLESARAVARGFQAQVANMNTMISQRIEEIERLRLEEEEKKAMAERRRLLKRQASVRGKPFNLSISNRPIDKIFDLKPTARKPKGTFSR